MSSTVQWLNANRHRSYPIVEDTIVAFTGPGGTVSLPTDLLLDLQFTSYMLRDGTMTILQFEISGGGTVLDITFQYTSRDGGETLDVTATVPVNPSTPYRLLTTTADYALNVVFGEGVATVLLYADGVYAAVSPTAIEPVLLVFQGRHRVDSLVGDTAESVPVSGDIYFEEGYSVVIHVNTASQSISITPAQGLGAGWPCTQLEPERSNCDDVLLRCNGVYASPEGIMQLVGGNGVAVIGDPDNHAIIIKTRVMPGEITCKGNRT